MRGRRLEFGSPGSRLRSRSIPARRDEIALFLAKCVLSAGTGGDGGIRSRLRGRFEAGRQSGHLSGSPRRSHHLRMSREREALSADMRRGGDGGRRAAQLGPNVSCWSIRSTGHGSSSPITASSPINVALIERGAPIAGAVYAPAIGRLWVGGDSAFACEARPGEDLPGEGSRRPIRTRLAPSQPDRLFEPFASRSASPIPSSKDCRSARRGSRARR